MQVQSTPSKEIETLFQLGAHLGHRKNRVHPKSYKYIYKVINGVSIIDLTKTVELLNSAKTFIASQAQNGKVPLVVATKRSISAFATDTCQNEHVPFITNKWQSGLITNFETIIKNVKKLEQMKDEQASGSWEEFVKHERIQLTKKLNRLDRFYKGLIGMTKLPDFLIVVDAKKEHNAITEAKRYNIPVIAIVDTNTSPEVVDYPIVMNDDSTEVVQYVLNELIVTYNTKKKVAPTKKESKTEEETAEAKTN